MTRAATRVLLREPRGTPQLMLDEPRTAIRRVLVCRPNHRLGNLLLLTPLLRELQRALPDAEVDMVLAGTDGAKLFRTFRNVGHIYTLSRRMVRHPLQTARIAAQIRHAHYDLVIDPCEGSQSSRLLSAIAHATCVVDARATAAGADRPSAADAPAMPQHMAKQPVYLLRQAVPRHGAADDYPALDLQLAPDEQRRGQQILDTLTSSSSPSVIGIFADATGAKRYSEAWWLGFIAALRASAPGFTIVEIAPPDGRSRLAARFPGFFSPDIREVAAVISRMACFISADCGVMHLSSASGTPTIGLFSVTDMAKYAPYGNGSCGIDTHGKSSEQVARLAAATVSAIQVGCAAAAPPVAARAGGRAQDTQMVHPDED